MSAKEPPSKKENRTWSQNSQLPSRLCDACSRQQKEKPPFSTSTKRAKRTKKGPLPKEEVHKMLENLSRIPKDFADRTILVHLETIPPPEVTDICVVLDAGGVPGRVLICNFLSPKEEEGILECVEHVFDTMGANSYLYGHNYQGHPLHIQRIDLRHSQGTDMYSPEGYIGTREVPGNLVVDVLLQMFVEKVHRILRLATESVTPLHKLSAAQRRLHQQQRSKLGTVKRVPYRLYPRHLDNQKSSTNLFKSPPLSVRTKWLCGSWSDEYAAAPRSRQDFEIAERDIAENRFESFLSPLNTTDDFPSLDEAKEFVDPSSETLVCDVQSLASESSGVSDTASSHFSASSLSHNPDDSSTCPSIAINPTATSFSSTCSDSASCISAPSPASSLSSAPSSASSAPSSLYPAPSSAPSSSAPPSAPPSALPSALPSAPSSSAPSSAPSASIATTPASISELVASSSLASVVPLNVQDSSSPDSSPTLSATPLIRQKRKQPTLVETPASVVSNPGEPLSKSFESGTLHPSVVSKEAPHMKLRRATGAGHALSLRSKVPFTAAELADRKAKCKRLEKLMQLMRTDFAIPDNKLKTIQFSDCLYEGGLGGMGQHLDSRTDYTGVIMTVSLLAKAMLHQVRKLFPVNCMEVPPRSCYMLTGSARGDCEASRSHAECGCCWTHGVHLVAERRIGITLRQHKIERAKEEGEKFFFWAQCDEPACGKWRKLPPGYAQWYRELGVKGEKFACYMSPDLTKNSCTIEEEPYSVDEDSDEERTLSELKRRNKKKRKK